MTDLNRPDRATEHDDVVTDAPTGATAVAVDEEEEGTVAPIVASRKRRWRDDNPGKFATLMIITGALLTAAIIMAMPLYYIFFKEAPVNPAEACGDKVCLNVPAANLVDSNGNGKADVGEGVTINYKLVNGTGKDLQISKYEDAFLKANKKMMVCTGKYVASGSELTCNSQQYMLKADDVAKNKIPADATYTYMFKGDTAPQTATFKGDVEIKVNPS